jgi:hypothetical protein
LTQTLPRKRLRARTYLTLLLLLPAAAMVWWGMHEIYSVPPGGTVSAIKLSTKQGLAGQASEAVQVVDPTTPDLYLVLTTPSQELELGVKKDTPVGNGLTWDLPGELPWEKIQRVDVWDHHTLSKNKQLDRITVQGWETDGQRFHIELIGRRNEPPKWALPLAAAGGAIALLTILKFVWDQVI